MAKYQYTINGTLQGVSSPANAVLALVNKQGSGKRITLRQLTVTPLRTTDTSSGISIVATTLSYATVSGGDPLAVVGMDSQATWPSDVRVVTNGLVSSPTRIISGHHLSEQYAASLVGTMHMGKLGGSKWRSLRPTARRGVGPSTLERLVVRPGESLALRVTYINRCFYGRVSVLLKVRGTPNRTFIAYGHTFVSNVDNAVFAVVNSSVSDVVEVMEWGFEEYGDGVTTPYLQLIPIISASPAVADTPSNKLAVFKMDSAYPDPSAWLYTVADTPVTALGVPDEYIAQGSALTPKGFNYLGTKDFVGPVYRTLFPEMDSFKRTASVPFQGASDYFASVSPAAMRDLFVQKSGIVLREGDGIALTPAVETAVNATVALSPGAQRPYRYSVTFDVENASQPYLTINGLVAGSDIVVRAVGSESVLQLIEDYSGSSWSWAYDQDTVPSCDIDIYKPGYMPLSFRNVALGSVGASIIAAQSPDPSYLE